MFNVKDGRMTRGRRRQSASRRPRIEGLEHRLLLYSTLDAQWVHGDRITFSIAPDGTDVGGVNNELAQTMASIGYTEAEWKEEIRRAAAVWQSVADINIAEVADSGNAISVPGNQQNDPRFGDIRVFGVPDPRDIVGYAFAPPPINGGTAAGDIVLNSDIYWQIDASIDLQTAAIHEFGHALGLDHSEFDYAAMYEYINGIKQGLAADDIDGIRSIYGGRQHDWLDQFHDNRDAWNAINVSGLIDGNEVTLAELDITSNGDDDWFYVQAPAGASGTMTVAMQSTGLSMLSPRFQVYNSSLQLAGWTVAPDAGTAFGETIDLQFTGVTPGTGVYIKAMGWNGGASGENGIGAYALKVDFDGEVPPEMFVEPPDTTVPEQPDQGGGTINGQTEEFKIADDPSEMSFHVVADDPGRGDLVPDRGRFRFGRRADRAASPSYGTVAFPEATRRSGPFAMRLARLAGGGPWALATYDATIEEVVDRSPDSGEDGERWSRRVRELLEHLLA